MANLRMLRDRILVLPIERKLSSIIEVKNTEKFNLGTVIACGPGKEINGRVHPMDVKVGDTIRWGEFDFATYEEAGVKYHIIQEADVAAVVEPEPFEFAFNDSPKWTEQEQKMMEEHIAKFGRGKIELNKVGILPADGWTEAEEEEFQLIEQVVDESLSLVVNEYYYDERVHKVVNRNIAPSEFESTNMVELANSLLAKAV